VATSHRWQNYNGCRGGDNVKGDTYPNIQTFIASYF